jgi:hypothetical protein
MAYNYSPISMPSSSGGGLDFGTLPRMQLGDTKSLTSFYDKQREHEDKESKFGQEEFTKLLKNLDADELEFAIGDDPRAREHLGQVTGYYTDKMKSLINRAGTPGTIKEMSKLSLDLYRDMNDPTGRLYPFVSAARERKKYLEKTKSAEYQKALAEDPDYDFENRQMFKNWKGSLSWNEEGMPQYNKLRIGEAEAPISLEGISKRLKGMVEESTIRGEEWVREFDPEGNLTGALKNIPSVKGRDPKAMAKLLREDKDFQRYINREMTKMEGASEEEKRKRREELQIGLLQGLSGFTMGDVSANVDDITTLNPEEQTDLKLKLDKFNEAKRHAAATESLGWANYAQRSQHHKDSQQAAERRHREKLSALGGSKDEFNIGKHRVNATVDAKGISSKYEDIFDHGKSPMHVGENYLVSKTNLIDRLRDDSDLASKLGVDKKVQDAFIKQKEREIQDTERLLKQSFGKTGREETQHLTLNRKLKLLKEQKAKPLETLVQTKLGDTNEAITEKLKAMQNLGLTQPTSRVTINLTGGVGTESKQQVKDFKLALMNLVDKDKNPELHDALTNPKTKHLIESVTREGYSNVYKVKLAGEDDLYTVDPNLIAIKGDVKENVIRPLTDRWNALAINGGKTASHDTSNDSYEKTVSQAVLNDRFLSDVSSDKTRKYLSNVLSNPKNFSNKVLQVATSSGVQPVSLSSDNNGVSVHSSTAAYDSKKLEKIKTQITDAKLDGYISVKPDGGLWLKSPDFLDEALELIFNPNYKIL